MHDILDSGQYTSNKYTKQFESSFKEEFNLKGECIAVNGCQNGLFLTLVALGVHRPILPDFTFSATAHAAYYACRDFKVADCDPRTFNLNLNGRSIAECDAVIGTHIFGCPCDHSELVEVANELQIPLIYDAAHAIGATYRGTSIGDLGTASVFSLSPTKAICAFEGGMIVTSNKCLAERLRKLRNYGNEPDYDCKYPGLNARMPEMNAAFALESLSTFRERQKHRFALVEEYRNHFAEEAMQQTAQGSVHAHKDFSLLLEDKKEKVCRILTERQIEFKSYFKPISSLSCYQGWLISQKNALRTYQSILQLPLHSNLDQDEVRRIGRIVSAVR